MAPSKKLKLLISKLQWCLITKAYNNYIT